MGNERIRQIGQGRLEGVRSGERTRLACWRPRPRGRELPFIFSAFRSARVTSVFFFCSPLLAPPLLARELPAPCASPVLSSRCPWSCRRVVRFLPATLVVFQQSHFIHHIVSAHLDVVDADSLARA